MKAKGREPPGSAGFWNDFRRFFIRGLAAVLPPLLTLMMVVWAFTFVQDKLGKHINTAAEWTIVQVICIT
ncbi:hypothetical protein LCGC14_2620950, partial [marine sediment metagenome]